MANIDKELNQIKNAVYGREVRGSIHDGIDKINKETEKTTNEQESLSDMFKQLIIDEGNSNAEVVASRGKEDWLPDRLNSFDSQLAHKANQSELSSTKQAVTNLQSQKADQTFVEESLSQKASQGDLNTEKGRIDNLVANAGDTDGNAELLDIRVGWDGIIYPTAGEAVRSIQRFMTSEDEEWVI